MAKKKRIQTVKVIAPKPFSLEDHLDIPIEAEKFELTEERTVANAKLVQSENPQITMTETVRNQDQLERFREVYFKELEKQNICQWGDETGAPCLTKFTDPDQAIAHMRYHWMFQNFDIKTARAVAGDIQDTLNPTSERSTTVHLTVEERKAILERHQKLLRADPE